MKRKRFEIFFAGSLILVLLIAGCISEEEKETEEGEFTYPKGVLKIGITGPMTGGIAAEGEEFVKGATMAVEEINARGGLCGYKIEIVEGDVQDFEAGTIRSVVERLINEDKVDAIFTGYSGNTQFEIDIMKEYNMIYIVAADSMSTTEIIGDNGADYPTVYNMVPSYITYRTELPLRMEKWASEGLINLPNRKVAIVTSDNAYSSWISEGLRDNFIAQGWEVTLYEMVAFGTITEWGPTLAKIRADPPALIINTDYQYTNEATFMEQFLQNPINSHVFMQYGPSTPEFINLLGDKATGVLYNLPWVGMYCEKYPQGIALREKFEERWGYEPGPYGPSLYCEVMVWANACERVGDPKDRVAVGKAIGMWTAELTAAGLTVFDPKTHLVSLDFMLPTFYQIWNQKRVLVDPDVYKTESVRNPPWWEE